MLCRRRIELAFGAVSFAVLACFSGSVCRFIYCFLLLDYLRLFVYLSSPLSLFSLLPLFHLLPLSC